MREFMKEYHIRLTTKGPVFVGNGQEYYKKEYIIDRRNGRVMIPKVNEMYSYLKKRGLERDFEEFMLHDRYHDLGGWLHEKRVPDCDRDKWIRYSMDCGDAISEKGLHVMQCIKDAYGNPYVPGSSLKGMLRTILLSYLIRKDSVRFRSLGEKMKTASLQHDKRDRYLARNMKDIEVEAFHTLDLKPRNKADMVNDCLSGLIISDSAPLSVDCLSLFQKVEYHKDGKETSLPLLRECIMPDTEISFTMTIDQTRCKFNIDEIKKAIELFSDCYYQFFLGKFPNAGRPSADTVWLGGGAGYVSKTINYPLFHEQGLQMAMRVFDNTLSGKQIKEHKHSLDAKLGVSPHVLKCTIYKGKKLQFGECTIHIE